MTGQEKKFTELTGGIDLREVISFIWEKKISIFFITFIFTITAIFYVVNLPNIYRSEAVLASAGDSSSLDLSGQLGGLAALAGVNIGGKGGDKSGLAIEIMKSRDFLGNFIEENNLYVAIMAVKGWDRESNKFRIDEKIYSEKQEKWVRQVEEPYLPKPSNLETIEEFQKLFNVSQDKNTGLVKVSFEHYSPFLAKDVLDKIIKAINEKMRSRDLIEAERSISYIEEQLKRTNITEMRNMLHSLIEEKFKTKILAHGRYEYVLKTIDPAVVNEQKSKPNRAVIVISIAFVSMFFSCVFFALRFISRRSKI